MRKYLISLLISILFMALGSSMWMSREFLISLSSSLKEGTEVTLNYKTPKGDFSQVTKVQKNGEANYLIPEKNIYELHFQLKTDDVKAIKEVNVRNDRKQKLYLFEVVKKGVVKSEEKKLILDDDLSYKSKLISERHIDIYNFIVIFCMIFYTVFFLFKTKTKKEIVQTSTSTNERMYNLDFLRIVVILSLLYCHFILFIPKVFNHGSRVVEFFFILSGFFLFKNLNYEETKLHFCINKIIRWMPLLLFFSVLRSLTAKNIQAYQMLVDFFFLPITGLHDKEGFIGQSWFLNILFWISLFYFSLYKTFEKKRANFIAGCIIFISYIGCVKSGWGMRGVLGAPQTFGSLFSTGLMRGLAGIGLGGFLYQLCNMSTTKHMAKHYVLYSVFEIMVFCLAILRMFSGKLHGSSASELFHVIEFFLIIYLFVQKEGFFSKLTDKPIFSKLAKYCLSLYLSHGIIAYSLIPYLLREYPELFSTKLRYNSIVFVMMGIQILIGIYAYHFVEKPGSRFLKNFFADFEKTKERV